MYKKHSDFLPPNLSSQFQDIISETIKQLQPFQWLIVAVVLGGGWKNQEIYHSDNNIKSDVDIFIFSNWLPLIWDYLTKIERQINARHPHLQVHFRGVIPAQLAVSKTFWAYKLKYEGITLSGNAKILQHIKADSNNISKIEAIRMLFQILVVRLVDLNSKKLSSHRITDAVIRGYLGIGEALLTHYSQLAPSYHERREKFLEIKNTLSLSDNLIAKIESGYNYKTIWRGVVPHQEYKNLTLPQIQEDCLAVITNLLSKYFDSNLDTNLLLNKLSEKFPIRIMLNLYFIYRIKNISELKSKFFHLVFNFNIIQLYKIAWYHSNGQISQRDKLIQTYWYARKDFSGPVLVKLFKGWPTRVTMEIK